MDYLVFDTEQAANTAAEKIYANMVGDISSEDLIDVTTGNIIDKDAITPEEAVQYTYKNRRFPVFGVNAATGVTNTESGYTTAWAIPQVTGQGKWVFQKPSDDILDGVTGYVVEPFNPEWFKV
jgi:hypothetical protein